MGSQISQSQQLRNTFPLSQYKILSEDKQFPQAVFLQRICDSSLFYACAVRTGQQGYEKSASKNVIKRVQRKQIGRTTYELYEWASANVQGLVQYINLIDKNRKISKSEYKAIVEGSVRGYNQISKQSFQIQCLQICMNKLRIFNEVSLKSVQNDSKQIVNSISVKIIPKNLNKSLSKPVQNGMKWENVGHCIHQGGVLTQKQLLGEYLLQLSNYATKSNSRQKRQRLNNLKNNFGTKMFQVIEALLSNHEWKQVVKILDKPETQAKQVDAHKVLNQIRNNIQTNGLKQKKTQTQKTIDTCDKNKSQKILFYCFKPQNNYQNEFKHQRNQNIGNIFIENNKAKINNFQYQNLIQRNMINSNNQYKSVSPLKSQRYFSPPSIKVIKEAIPPKITNEKSPQLAKNQPRYDETSNQFNDLNLTKTNSILTIYPDIFTDQMGTRNRIYSARNINPQLFSPEAKKPINFFGSPPKNQNQIKQSHNKSTHNIEQRKGKKIQFKPSKPNAILNVPIILEYQPKIKPDFIQGNKKQQIEFRQAGFPRNQTFISQQFDRLGFGLSDKYFGSENKKVVPNQSNLKKTHMQVAPKVQLKMDYLKVHSTVSNNNKYRNVNVKQVQSQTILIEPQINVHNMKNNQLQNKVPELKESKYVGPVNIKGQKEGYGQIIFPSGGSYVGNFYKDFMHGDGKLLYPSGRTAYEGTFKYDKFHGSGKLYNENPTYIQAFDFRNFNKIQVTQKEQPIHREHFLINGVQREKKISYWKYYEGQMNCDMKHGKGLMILQNGQKFEGQFKNDLVNGKGTFYGQNGRITGKWEDNLLIEIYR